MIPAREGIEAAGEELFALACKLDLEGIVAKHNFGPYLEDSAHWFKIRDRKYSQRAGREKFFQRERDVDPDIFLKSDGVFGRHNAEIKKRRDPKRNKSATVEPCCAWE